MNYKFLDSLIYRLPALPLKNNFTREEINDFFVQPKNLEALFLASPVLHDEFVKIESKKTVKDEGKVYSALLKYMLRMHSRCTPFGLFASCGVTQWSESSGEMVVPNTYARSTRLDMHFTVSLAMALAKQDDIKQQLKFFPNSSIYESGEKMRYVEYFYKNKRRIHQISAVDNSEYLDKILKAAKSGKTIHELVESIIDEEVGIDDAMPFVEQIIDSQLLVSELEPGVTGDELTMEIVKTLSIVAKRNPSKTLSDKIKILTDVLHKIDQVDQKVINSVDVYHEISNSLKATGIDFDVSKLFQTDLFLEGDTVGPDHNVKRKLLKTMKLLRKLSQNSGETNLSRFKEKFYQRYEENEVPLLVALDNEMGIGYASSLGNTSDVSPLLEALALPYKAGESKITWNQIQAFLLSKISDAQIKKQRVVTLDQKDFDNFEDPKDNLPLSLPVMFSIFGIENGEEKIYFNGAGGSSAANLLGRFASGSDSVKELVNDIVAEEDKLTEGSILAEIVHLPENRVGNILMRPTFRNFEIPYLSKSNLPKENQIDLEDLMVSVKYGRKLVLRSKKLNKEILPRMANAHNFSANALPVYQFLCDLQSNTLDGGVYFSWGALQNNFAFLPRVEVAGVIVSLAKWKLNKDDFKELTGLKKEEVLSKVDEWREKHELDKVVMLVEGDNKLLINFEDPENIAMFLLEIKKKASISLEEFLYDKTVPFVKGAEGIGFANEFVAPLMKELKNDKPAFVNQDTPLEKKQIQRSFSIGEEWLYYKLYCGVKTADEVLAEAILPLAKHLKEQGIIDRWFFIRYADPELHLRVRFHFTDMSRMGEAIQLFQNAIRYFRENGLIWKLQTDTYQRELERYGTNTMVLSEELFYYEGEAICKMLALIEGDEGEQIRWQFCMRALDQLLDDFSYTLDDRLILMNDLKIGFAKEFNSNKHLNKQIDKKYRANRENITSILDKKNDFESELKPLFEILESKSASSAGCISEILAIKKEGLLELGLDDLMSSYIHMLLNRLFRNNQRTHELVVYDFMWRWYRTQVAMAKKREMSTVS